ncbi:pirin family protein [Acaryochloris sp. IP29b_bin.148]|uniref:pirin family protein n=1 Tax=Acaryochloris sp. IP29b_bin.148 TaxID=2969218 RepID=UPI00260DA526|nr:pirin family protein [Acaryochloris sp. IP29b_bin.148]
MIDIRLGQDRGWANNDWLNSRHTFSFGSYYDPNYMGFASLRVINEDTVQPGQGFGLHHHQEMEIISYVLEGALEHQDSLGNSSIIRPGDVQRMTAGTGIQHSEYNPSASEPVHFLQIWIVPETNELAPGYEQIHSPIAARHNRLQLMGSRTGRDGSMTIHQDVNLYASTLSQHRSIAYALPPQRVAWLQVAKGAIQLNGTYNLTAGDAAAITELQRFEVQGQSEASDILLFDIAA